MAAVSVIPQRDITNQTSSIPEGAQTSQRTAFDTAIAVDTSPGLLSWTRTISTHTVDN